MPVPWRLWRRRSPTVVPAGLSPFGWVRYGRYYLGEFENPGRKGPKKMLPQPGTYKAKTAQGVVYETDGGALMVAFDFGIDEQTSIVGRQCLVSKAGEVMQNTVRSLKEAFGWDGADPFWFADTDLSDRDVEIVVEMERGQDGREHANVRWINAPGRAGGLSSVKPADRKAVLAKYGMKFRALSGGTTVRPAPSQAAAPKAAPGAPPQAVPPPAAAPSGKPMTIQEAWTTFCAAGGSTFSEAEVTKQWHALVGEVTGGKAQEAVTPEEWGAVAARASDWMRDQLPL